MKLPSTRYYGSKRRVMPKIWEALDNNHIEFDSILDIFGGSGIVSYFMAAKGKNVIYNDILSFNCEIAKALLNSPRNILSSDEAIDILNPRPGFEYNSIIEENFDDIYFSINENRQIDIAIQNIDFLLDSQKSSAYYILFQSCMIKRPFNIFHRKNLNLRTNFCQAKFGNKKTWDIPFESLFAKFSKELSEFQFIQTPNVIVSNRSALNCNLNADLIYIDTPYFNNNCAITYHSRYHFLEGLMNYHQIPDFINNAKANKEILFGKNPEFEVKSNFINDLKELISLHQNSIIALSYTSPGYPSIETLADVISDFKKKVIVCNLGNHSFALNRNNKDRSEFLLIGI